MTRVRKMVPPAPATVQSAKALRMREALPRSQRAGVPRTQTRAAGIASPVIVARRIEAGKQVDAGQLARFFAHFQAQYDAARQRGDTPDGGGVMLAWELYGGEPMRKAVRTRLSKISGQPNPRASKPSIAKIKRDAYTAGLGGLVEIVVQGDDGQLLMYSWRRPYPLLWWSPQLRVLAAVDGGTYSRPRALSDDVPAKVIRVREEFHGTEATTGRDVTIPDGPLHTVGHVVSLAYQSDKRNGGDGRRRTFEHDHAPSDVMWAQQKSGPALIVVNGARLTVTDRGIVY